MKVGDIVQDSPESAALYDEDDYQQDYDVETGIIEIIHDSEFPDPILVRWLYGENGNKAYRCPHEQDELSMYCPKEKLW